MLHSWWNVATYRQCRLCYTVDGMLHIQAMFVCYMLMECCTYRQCSSVIRYTVDGMLHIKAIFVCYMLHSWWNVAHTGNVRLLYATQLTECCTYRQCSSVICYTVDGMLHIQAMFACYMSVDGMLTYRQCSSVICYTVDGMLHIQEMFACYMLHSWWNVAHAGNVRLLYATQLMECCTYRQCSSVICYTVDGMLHLQEMFACYMLHSWWNVAHAGNVRLLYAAQLMECCTYRQCSYVICYTVDGMLHTQAMFVCYMLHSWWNVAHTGNVRLLYATQLMDCCTYRQCSSVICCTVDGMLHIQAMLVCYMLHSWWNVAHTAFVCYMIHSWWNVAHTGNSWWKAIFVCYMLHSWWNVAHTGNVRLFICYTVDGMLHIQAMFVCYMLHSWWNVAHTGNVRLLYATQLMECCTYRQCSSVICYTVDGMLHIQAMFVCYMLHSWWNVAHTGNVRLLYATLLMECCTCRQCSSVICYTVDGMLHIEAMFLFVCYRFAVIRTVDGMLHIKAIFVCYMLHSWWNVAHTGNVRLLYDTQLMECCTYRQCSSVIRYTVDGMLHIKAIFVCYMLHSWWNVAHTGNVRLLYDTQLTECCTYRQCSSVICYTVDGMLHIQGMLACYMLHSWWDVNIQAMFVCYMLDS